VKVIVSNGCFKFHMAPGAAQLHALGVLGAMITGGYPKLSVQALAGLPGLRRNPAIARLRDREEAMPESLVHSMWLPELEMQIGRRIAAVTRRPTIAIEAERHAMHAYARSAARLVSRLEADVYHYRAGYGRESVRVARSRGMLTLCDHSIAHPAVVDHLVDHDGRMPSARVAGRVSRFWTSILADIEDADHVLVNSEFVRDTFRQQGWAAERISVVYLGVDDKFLAHVARRPDPAAVAAPGGPLRVMFAGGLTPRKGFGHLVAALEQLRDIPWALTVAGSGDSAYVGRYSAFLRRPEVRFLGMLSREELARELGAAEVFVFPSLVEGSARVVFEALAAGCYVVTTVNSGSIVEQGRHGSLVPSGEPTPIAEEIRNCYSDRARLAAIGRQNQALVFAKFNQAHYGTRLVRLYHTLLAQRGPDDEFAAESMGFERAGSR
jgi:glycosyltransferase involved in cell wall biosynthesis